MSKAQELIKKEGLGGMIITDPYNMRHISGFRGGEGALYISATQQVLITDSRYTEPVSYTHLTLPTKRIV